MTYIETDKLQISVPASKIGSQNERLLFFISIIIIIIIFINLFANYFFRDAKLVDP